MRSTNHMLNAESSLNSIADENLNKNFLKISGISSCPACSIASPIFKLNRQRKYHIVCDAYYALYYIALLHTNYCLAFLYYIVKSL